MCAFFGRLFIKRFALCYQTVVCLSVCPVLTVCDIGVLWPNGCMHQDKTWHAGRPWPSPQCVRWGPSSPSSKGAQPPQFSAHICCGQMVGWIKIPLGMEVGLGPGNIAQDGTQLPLRQNGGTAPQVLAHIYCGQTAGWINIPLR